MIIRSIDIEGVRNLSIRGLALSRGLTLVLGENGSGKTSIIEAINILFTGKSFRTAGYQKVIQSGKDEAWVSAELLGVEEDALLTPSARLSVLRYRDGKFKIKLGSENIGQFSKIAAVLPVQTLGPDLPNLVDMSPKGRGKYLDWAVFHVKHDFHPAWVAYMGALKQRNALLKERKPDNPEFEYWEGIMANQGALITEQRQQVFEQLEPYINHLVSSYLGEVEGQPLIKTLFYKGWSGEKDDFQSVLAKQRIQDMAAGMTRMGPHRVEVKFFLRDGAPAKERLSRGQRKALSYALVLAQMVFFKEVMSRNTLVLIDDFSSELDAHYQKMVLKMLAELGAQVLITEINSDNAKGVLNLIEELKIKDQVFQIEAGEITKELSLG